MKNITGPPVEGDDFFGRDKELQFAWRQIENGNSLILAAPRRVGKSSFAKKLLVKAKEENWKTLEINLEEIKTEESFVKLLVEKLQEQNWWQNSKRKLGDTVETLLSNLKASFEYEGMKTSFEYQKRKENVYEDLKKLFDSSENTLIMVDELTILLASFLENDKEEGKKNVEFFLNWLRSFRQVTGNKIRWIFCSSIGIDNFASLHQLSYTLNDINPFEIGAFTHKQATSFLKELAKSESIELSPELIEYILLKLGWNLPYFIQILFNKIYYLNCVDEKELNQQTVDEAYTSLLSEKHLNTWDERLKEYAELESSIRKVLTNLSGIAEGQNRTILLHLLYAEKQDEEKANLLLSKVLTILTNDGYLIVNEQGNYLFRSPLLRDFWFNRFRK